MVHLCPLHQLLGLPKAAGLATLAAGITDPIAAPLDGLDRGASRGGNQSIAVAVGRIGIVKEKRDHRTDVAG
jgi:hypothetical protein